MIPFLVSVFDKATLSNLVKECFGSDFPDIFKKKQIDYIYRYLKDMGAQSILLEFEYVDRDFLEDYSLYYVKRFSGSGNKCARLHFFSSEVKHTTVELALSFKQFNNERTELQENYLGFMVVKPLPKTFIGKTCLKTYPGMIAKNDRKCLTRIYDVDLFGVQLKVESVAFQEQDKVVSACATTAIWSTLHAMRWREVREIPACSEITINAINHIDGSHNHFPSKELSNKQILRALDIERFRNHFIKVESYTPAQLLTAVKYHIDSGLPLILGADVYSVSGGKELVACAGHAVSVLGYKKADASAIYIHDDRLGPFARATFISLEGFKTSKPDLQLRWGLTLQGKDDSGNWVEPHEVFLPTSLTIPTPKKVRLSYEIADATCNFIQGEYDAFVRELREKRQGFSFPEVTYSVRLSEISKIRQDAIVYDFTLSGMEKDVAKVRILERERLRFLTKSYARYHWVAEFEFDGKPAFDILFDATDIPQGNGVSGIFRKNYSHSEAILAVLEGWEIEQLESTGLNFCMSLKKYLHPPVKDYKSYLDDTYGEVRAPLYLKAHETPSGNMAKNLQRRQYYGTCPNPIDEELGQLLIRNDPGSFLLWVIAHDGSLLIGPELNNIGHPALTEFKPARIAGELSWNDAGWHMNSKSGRYSGDYTNSRELLENAVEKMRAVFYLSRELIFASYREEK